MLETYYLMALCGGCFLFVVMSITAIFSESIKNAGIVDVIWALGFIPLVLIDAYLGEGALERKWLLVSMISIANLRLGWHLLRRAVHAHPEEDPRYHALREQWGNSAGWKFWLVFLLQGLIMLLLSVPFMLIANNPKPAIHALEWVGIGIWLVGLIGEAIADGQLASFKRQAENKGKICLVGLWRYSRHPNYFFEWVQWIGIAVFALMSPFGAWMLYVPILMLYLLTKVTGVAATEAQMLKSRGEPYRQYQQATSAFVPWPPKSFH